MNPQLGQTPATPAVGKRNTLFLYSTTVSDTGYVRSNNQDSSFAGERLIAICDGMGGHAGGDTASTIAVRSLAHIEVEPDTPQTVGEVAALLETSVIAAHDAIVGKAKRERKLAGMGTTVTAVALVEDHWVLAHIGDSRAYLLRNGRIIRATKDHSYVQHLIDIGKITPGEAKNHPQRNVVMRVLGDFDIDPRPDISVRKAQPGDRWMLCSDGVCGVLSDSTIRETLETVTNPQECAQQLVGMALKAGSTDNCTAVIADANIPLDPGEVGKRHQVPLVGGAVSSDLSPVAEILGTTVAQAPRLRDEYAKSPAQKAAELAHAEVPSPVSAPAAESNDLETQNADMQGASASQAPVAEGAMPQNDEASTSVIPAVAELAADAAGMPGAAASDDVDDVDAPISGSFEDDSADDDQPVNIAVPSAQKESADDTMPDTSEIPIVTKRDGTKTTDPHDPAVAKALHHEKVKQQQRDIQRKKRSRGALAAMILLVVVVVAGSLFGAWRWSQNQYYIGESNGYVAIYKGVNTNIFGWNLSHVEEMTPIHVDTLDENSQQQLQKGLAMGSLEEARDHVAGIVVNDATVKQSEPSESASSDADSSSASSLASDSASGSDETSADGSSDNAGASSDGASSETGASQ